MDKVGTGGHRPSLLETSPEPGILPQPSEQLLSGGEANTNRPGTRNPGVREDVLGSGLLSALDRDPTNVDGSGIPQQAIDRLDHLGDTRTASARKKEGAKTTATVLGRILRGLGAVAVGVGIALLLASNPVGWASAAVLLIGIGGAVAFGANLGLMVSDYKALRAEGAGAAKAFFVSVAKNLAITAGYVALGAFLPTALAGNATVSAFLGLKSLHGLYAGTFMHGTARAAIGAGVGGAAAMIGEGLDAHHELTRLSRRLPDKNFEPFPVNATLFEQRPGDSRYPGIPTQRIAGYVPMMTREEALGVGAKNYLARTPTHGPINDWNARTNGILTTWSSDTADVVNFANMPRSLNDRALWFDPRGSLGVHKEGYYPTYSVSQLGKLTAMVEKLLKRAFDGDAARAGMIAFRNFRRNRDYSHEKVTLADFKVAFDTARDHYLSTHLPRRSGNDEPDHRALPLGAVLEDPKLLSLFRQHCGGEFNAEGLDFLVEGVRFLETLESESGRDEQASPKQIAYAKKLYQQFIKAGSPREINLQHRDRQAFDLLDTPNPVITKRALHTLMCDRAVSRMATLLGDPLGRFQATVRNYEPPVANVDPVPGHDD